LRKRNIWHHDQRHTKYDSGKFSHEKKIVVFRKERYSKSNRQAI